MEPVHSGGGGQRERLAVGIDLGTTNTKLALVAIGPDSLAVRALAAAPTPEPAALGATLRAMLARVLAGSRPPDAIGIASMAETGVPLDAAGRSLDGWLRWDGHRARAEADALADRLGRAELVAATGVRPSAKVPLATWAWLRAHRPEQWAAMRAWAGVADLACHALTGALVTDHTLAGRTMAYRLPPAGAAPGPDFDADLLAEVGLTPDRMPRVAPPGTVAGRTTAAFTAAGVAAGTPVTVAGHDHAVGAYACGVRHPGDVADSVGTAEAVVSVVAGVPDPVAVADAGMSSVVTVGGAHRAILAGSSTAGAVVRWWLDHEAPGLDPDLLFAEVLALGTAPGEVIVLPYLSGRQTPSPDPDARLRVLGRRPGHTRAELAKAMLEGLCLHARWMLHEQQRLAGGPGGGRPVALLGGPLVSNAAWRQLKGAVTGRPAELVTAEQPVAAGAALVAAARAGLLDRVPALPREPLPGSGPERFERSLAAFVAAATDPDSDTRGEHR